MKPFKDFSKTKPAVSHGFNRFFIKFCESLSSSVEMKDFLLNLNGQIPKKFKSGELFLFYKSEQLGVRRAYVKNSIFYEQSAQQGWPIVNNIRQSSVEENLYLAKEFGRPFFKTLMIPIFDTQSKALLVLELGNTRLLESLIDFFEKRKTILELAFKRVYWKTHFSRISYLWSQLFSYWWEPLAILKDFQVLLENDSFKSLSLSKEFLKKKKTEGLLEKGKKIYQLHYYSLKKSLGVLYCQDMTNYFVLKEQLFQNEKISLLSSIGQNMSHRLNNPLTGVKAMTQVLKRNPVFKNFEEEFKELDKAIQRSQKIIESFLSFSKSGDQLKSCNINQILEDTLLLLKKATRGIKLETRFYKKDLEIKGDFALLQQAFYNLILNACQALAEDKDNKNPIIHISAYPILKDEVCLKIKDNGIGIEEKNLKKIFQPFWTNKKSGTGFGLGVTRKIIQQFNGKVFVSSQKNQFTCFTLIFPAYSSEDLYSLNSEFERGISP